MFERQEMNNKVVIGVIGCLGAALLFTVVIGLGVAVWLFTERPKLDASLSLPSEATLGETLTMLVTTTNPHDQAVTLDSIDIDDTFLDGFQVVTVVPEPTGTMHVFGQRSWSFGTSVPPGQALEVRFTLKAVQGGHFSGDVDVCNPAQDFTTLIADVMVGEEPSDRPDAGDGE